MTISEEQAAAIETNAEKRSYPQADEEKLAGVPDDLETQLSALNGADIEVTSKKGEGTKFTVTFNPERSKSLLPEDRSQ